MNKSELADHIATQHKCTKAKATEVINMFTTSVIDILALIKVRDVNLISIALLICGKSQIESGYHKLQRFFTNTEICYVCLAKLIVNLAKVGDKKWVLVIG